MKFFIAAAAVIGAVAASNESSPKDLPELFSRIPTCADKCVADAMPGLCPSVESYWCRCHNSVKGRLMSKTFDCAMEACGGMQQALEYQEATNAVCDEIMEVTLRGQKHVELRQVGSGSVAPSGSVGSVRPSGSVRGSGSGSGRAMSSATGGPTASTPAPATGAASSFTVSSSYSAIAFGSVAGLALISAMGMLI